MISFDLTINSPTTLQIIKCKDHVADKYIIQKGFIVIVFLLKQTHCNMQFCFQKRLHIVGTELQSH